MVYSQFISTEYAHGNGIGEQLFHAFVIGDVYWFCYAVFICFLLAPLLWTKNGGKKKASVVGIVLGILCLCLANFISAIGIGGFPYFQIGNAISIFPAFVFGYCMDAYSGSIEKIPDKLKKLIYIFVFIFAVGSQVFLLSNMGGMLDGVVRYVTGVSWFLVLLPITKIFNSNYVVAVLSRYSLQIMFFDAFYKAVLYVVMNKFLELSIWMIFPIAVLDITLSVLSCIVIEKIPYIRKIFGL